ncbi:MAG: hypothetical protein ACM3MK_01585 [Chitinophagales bacterium]
MDVVSQINAPYTDEELYMAVLDAFDKCNSEKPNDISKLTSLERFLNVKGYSKAVKNRRLIIIHWNIKEGYYLTPTVKTPRRGFVHMDNHIKRLGHSFTKDRLMHAFIEAVKESS